MSTPHPSRLPPALRDALARDSEPVRPLRAPWQRSMAVAVWFVGVLLILPQLGQVFSLREDLGLLAIWLPTILQALLGLGLIHLALREAVPGQALRDSHVVLVSVAALVVQGSVATISGLLSHVDYDPVQMFWKGSVCARTEAMLGVPALLLTIWLAFRAYPVRPAVAGLLGGLGAGLFADGVQHLHCPMGDFRHVIVWHVGGMTLLALLGAGLGVLLQKWQFFRKG
jgi:hypothetical protein